MSDANADYQQLLRLVREISLLGSVSSVLGWDEHVNLPPKGVPHRGNQSALLSRMCHEMFTSPRIGQLLCAVETSGLIVDPQSDPAVNVREIRRLYNRATKLPAALVEEMAKTEVLAQHAWAQARKAVEFKTFAPWLCKWIDLKRQEAQCVGYASILYDALLDPYEPGETTANLRRVFESLRAPLVELIGRIAASPRKAPVEILHRHYPQSAQAALAHVAARNIGFDFEAGRLDVTLHPFCSDLGPGDVRITTRYDERYFGDAFFGVLHETGHALYEQGLDPAHFGTPLGNAISLGIHESQSRLWENLVGRSRAFWLFFFSKAREAFPHGLAGVSMEDWIFAVNDVRPSFIRTESDQATYNLHILLRFELEQSLLSGQLPVDDLPQAWNQKMRDYLGLTPPDDAQGCLQDIHWSIGSFGYFPTYTLGNLYAAQFFEQARHDLGDLDAQFSRGEFAPLLAWLRQNIHRHGQRYTASQLVKKVTGKELSAGPLLDHLQRNAQQFFRL